MKRQWLSYRHILLLRSFIRVFWSRERGVQTEVGRYTLRTPSANLTLYEADDAQLTTIECDPSKESTRPPSSASIIELSAPRNRHLAWKLWVILRQMKNLFLWDVEDLLHLKSLFPYIKFLKKNSPALEISRNNNSGTGRNREFHASSSQVSLSKFNFQRKDMAYSNWDYVSSLCLYEVKCNDT
jgi:hypothetical protein